MSGSVDTRPAITIVTHKLVRTDGQGRVNAEVAVALAKQGWQVTVVSSEIGKDIAAQAGVNWVPVVVPGWVQTTLIRYQAVGVQAGRALARLPPADIVQLNGGIAHGAACDVNVANFVHAHWIQSAYHPSRGVRKLRGAYQYLFTRLNMAWERRAFARAARIIAVSDQVRDALVRWVGVDPSKIAVIPPGVDARQFRPLERGETNRMRAETGVADRDFLLVFVGDAQGNRKNLDLVLHALPRLDGSVHLAVIGDPTRGPYPAMAERLGVAGRCHFLGGRTVDLPDLLRGADAFVLLSHYDPFALVVTEAMASGLPVVTVPTVGASSLIRDGENGFVLPDATALEPLVRVVDRLRLDPTLRAAVGRAARATAEALSWEAMAARYADLYARIIAGRREPPACATPDRTLELIAKR